MQKKIIKLISRYKKAGDYAAILFFVFLVGVFFYQTIIFAKLPVPTDALVGLYHPYRDTYAPSYPNGVPFKNFLITDPVRQQIPWRKTVVESLRKGSIPLWDAYSFSGTPLLANIQSGALYPLNIIFLFLPFALAWTILIISQPLLAGIFLYLFLRNRRLEILPSLVGAICFAFSGFSIAWLTWGTILSTWAWTPLSLLSVDKLHDSGTRNKNIWRILFVLSVACSFFAGHLQIFFYSILFISLYSVRTYFRRRPAGIPLVHIGIALCIALITSPVWFPIIQWLPGTGRLAQGAVWTHEGFFIPIQHLIQFFVPDYFGNPATLNYWGTWNYGEMIGYIGVGGLLLAGFGITSSAFFWTLMTVAVLLFAVNSPFAQLPFRMHIPVLSSLQPTRLLVIVDFCLSILAAHGLSRLMKNVQKRTIILILSVVGIFYLLLWISVFMPGYFAISTGNAIVARRNLVLPSILYILISVPLFAGSIWPKFRKRFGVIVWSAIILITVVDLFRFGWKFTPFTDSKYFFPQTKILSFLEKQDKPFRIMATDDRILPPNVNEYYGLESVSGYDPIHSERYEEFIAAMDRGTANIQPPFGFDRIIAPKNVNSPLFQLLNVRYVLSFDDLNKDGFHMVGREGETAVFENTNLVPRVYLAQDVIYKSGKQEVINALYDSGFNPGITAVTEVPIDVLNMPLTLSEAAEIQSYKPDEIRVKVTTSNQRLLVIGNMFNNGWHAAVDNKPALLVRVNYLFFGVLLPPGSHIVVLRYY